MPITLDQFVERVFYNIGTGAPEQQAGVSRAAIEASLPSCLTRLGQRVADDEDPATRARLQKPFSLTLTSGDVACDATIVTSRLPGSYATLTGTSYPLLWVPFYRDLISPPPLSEFYFWTMHEGKIKVRTSTGAVPASTNFVVVANYVPIISEVPDEVVEDLIEIGVELNTLARNAAITEQQAVTI